MITDAKNKAGPARWADYVIRAAAGRPAPDRSSAMRKSSLPGFGWQNATGLSLAEAADNELHGQLWWSRGRRDELATALDEWENEGGGISR